jgi:Family of unknown function (DUF5719)
VKGLIANRIVPLLVVVLALAGAAALTGLRHSVTVTEDTSGALSSAVAVNAQLRACPAAGVAGSPGASVALVASSPASGSGRAVVSRLGAAGSPPLHTLSRPGVLSQLTVRAASRPPKKTQAAGSSSPSPVPAAHVPAVPVPGGVVVQASAAMASGLEVEQVPAGESASARCESPGTDFWFTGPGRFSVPRIQIFLLNVDSQAAVVNVEAFTDAGPLQGGTDTGIAVAPHSMVSQSLAPILHGSRVIALHVRTSVGQVVAAAEEIRGGARSGAWLPASQAPATRVFVPGLPATPGTRQLYVAVPGVADAHVKITAITSRGTYEPTGGGALDIPGGSAIAIPLSALSGIPGALRVSANVPVFASVMLPGGPRGAPGVFSSTAWPIRQQGVVAYNGSGARESCQLVLTAPAQVVRVRITLIGHGGPLSKDQVVQVKSKHSKVVQLGGSSGSRRRTYFAVVITPLAGSGPVYAGRVLINGGTIQSILPVASALTRVPMPPVQNTVIAPTR